MKRLILFFSLILLSFTGYSSHYMGGEITWECLPNGNYRFIMKLYRECDGINYSTSETLRSNVPGWATINMRLVPGANPLDALDGSLDGKTDLSPRCYNDPNFPKISCATVTAPNLGGVEEWYYTSDQTYPNGVALTGVPPTTGYAFWHTSCCRNPCTNITNSASISWHLRAYMYPYTNPNTGVTLNTSTCYDNSPVFAEVPSAVICTGYPFRYNHNAFDTDLDSLSYEWAPPLNTSLTAPIVTYAPGYSYSNPLPGPTHNPNNVSGTVNPYTGEISFESYTQGAFVTVTKITAWRCGQKIAEVFREMQIVLRACDTNYPPIVQAPFQDPISGLYTSYTDTVHVGDIVTFTLSGTDFEFVDPPANTIPQTLTITASSPMFGDGFTNSAVGCLNPPCATLNPPPPISAMYGVQTSFTWQTSCDHVVTDYGCNTSTKVYKFLIKTSDDFCPVPAMDVATITIVVLPIKLLESPELRCVSVLQGGDVQLTWYPLLDDPDSSFIQYNIYHATNIAGPYTKIDSIQNMSINTYTHNGTNTNNQNNYYYLTTNSGCYGLDVSNPSDTLAAILLNVNNLGYGAADLNWNHLHSPPLPSSGGMYKVYREYPIGTWTLIDYTPNTSYCDTNAFNNQFINYRIEIYDDMDSLGGCYSVSNTDGYLCGISGLDINGLALWQNAPNPANTFTKISYQIPETGDLRFEIINILGQTINSLEIPEQIKGKHEIEMDVNALESGIYFIRMTYNNQSLSNKMIIAR